MKKKSYHYYVMVCADNGPVFVTSLGEHHTAYWNREEKPMEFSKFHAEDLAMGLNMNGFGAFPVFTPAEVDYQPYRYDFGQFTWEWKKAE